MHKSRSGLAGTKLVQLRSTLKEETDPNYIYMERNREYCQEDLSAETKPRWDAARHRWVRLNPALSEGPHALVSIVTPGVNVAC